MDYFHVRISLKSQRSHDETKTDLSEEQLNNRIIKPYEEGMPIIINGKAIQPDDISRIRIGKSQVISAKLIADIEAEDRHSSVIMIGGPSDEWRAADRATDVTDDYIKGPIGYKKSLLPNSEVHNELPLKSENKVFIVHGHDSELKNDIYAFLRDIGLEPIILNKKPDEGLTIIEKFEKHSDVNYAFVLLTPDDAGMQIDELKKTEKNRKVEFRARQNVIFELGFFVAKLGRQNVCCVYKEDVTLPNDISGLLYKKVSTDINSIGHEIIKELKTAGITIKI